jgi:hypothetical protein
MQPGAASASGLEVCGAALAATEKPNVSTPPSLFTNTAPSCIAATALTIDSPSPWFA